MSLALACWGVVVAAYYSPPTASGTGRRWGFCGVPSSALSYLRQAGRVALLASLVLFAPVSRIAVELLACETVSMPPAGVLGLNGGGSIAMPSADTTGGGGASIHVSTLGSNHYFVCWARSGAHLPAGVLAALTLAVYVVALPLLTLRWALADRALALAGSGSCHHCEYMYDQVAGLQVEPADLRGRNVNVLGAGQVIETLRAQKAKTFRQNFDDALGK